MVRGRRIFTHRKFLHVSDTLAGDKDETNIRQVRLRTKRLALCAVVRGLTLAGAFLE